jgi:sarcosine oxidase
MAATFDVIVVGLGAMGSAAAYHLARAGKTVLGLEAFGPAHDKGSSHGESRIIRQAYFEDSAYVQPVLRAYELWRDLEKESGAELLTITGGLSIGAAQGELVSGCLKSAMENRLAYELLDVSQMRQRFPQFSLGNEEVAFYEEMAGYLRPEECIRQHLHGAANRGADLHFDEPMTSWQASPQGDGVSVTTSKQTFRTRSLVLSVGPWFTERITGLTLPVVISRRVMFWLKPLDQPSSFDKQAFPILIWEPAEGPIFYGFPRLDDAGHPKVGLHSGKVEVCSPASIDRSIRPQDESEIRAVIASRIPALNGEVVHAATCMYSTTPDHNFIVDRHPGYPQVILAGGFSGHGFKFSSVVGEILCDLAVDLQTASKFPLFSCTRFAKPA